ncbi:MAG: hypothetical protein ACFBZ9_05300 [Sphingomonadales bacterium]
MPGASLLRISDGKTADNLIAKHLSEGDWAGHCCSVLHILCDQEEIADPLLHLLSDATQPRLLGDRAFATTSNVRIIAAAAGDVISSASSRDEKKEGPVLASLPIPERLDNLFVVLTVVEINSIIGLGKEVFGSVLYVLQYQSEQLDDIPRHLRRTGSGLTLPVALRPGADSRHQHNGYRWKRRSISANRLFAAEPRPARNS